MSRLTFEQWSRRREMLAKSKAFPWISLLLAFIPVMRVLLEYFGLSLPEELWGRVTDLVIGLVGGAGVAGLAKAEPVGKKS